MEIVNCWSFVNNKTDDEIIQSIEKDSDSILSGLIDEVKAVKKRSLVHSTDPDHKMQLIKDKSLVSPTSVIHVLSVISHLNLDRVIQSNPLFEKKVEELVVLCGSLIAQYPIGKENTSQFLPVPLPINRGKTTAKTNQLYQESKIKEIATLIEQGLENGQKELVTSLIISLPPCLPDLEAEFNKRGKSLYALIFDYDFSVLFSKMSSVTYPTGSKSFFQMILERQSFPFLNQGIKLLGQLYEEDEKEFLDLLYKPLNNRPIDLIVNHPTPFNQKALELALYAACKRNDRSTLEKICRNYPPELVDKLLLKKYINHSDNKFVPLVAGLNQNTKDFINNLLPLKEERRFLLLPSSKIFENLTQRDHTSRPSVVTLAETAGIPLVVEQFQLMSSSDLVKLLRTDVEGLSIFYRFIDNAEFRKLCQEKLDHKDLVNLIFQYNSSKITYFKKKEKERQKPGVTGDSFPYLQFIHQQLGEDGFVVILTETLDTFVFLNSIKSNVSSMQAIQKLLTPNNFIKVLNTRNKHGNHPFQIWAVSQLKPFRYLRDELPNFAKLFNQVDSRTGDHLLHLVARVKSLSEIEEFCSLLAEVDADNKPLAHLEEILVLRNGSNHTPIDAAARRLNHDFFLFLMKEEKTRNVLKKQISPENPLFLSYFLSLFANPKHSHQISQLPALEEIFEDKHFNKNDYRFFAALQAKSLEFLWRPAYTARAKDFLAPYPYLQNLYEASTSYEDFITKSIHEKSAFVENLGDLALEAALFVGNDELLFHIVAEMGSEKVQKQLERLQAKYPWLKERLAQSVEELEWIVDDSHMRLEILEEFAVPEEILKKYQYQDILTGFKEINFNDPSQPGYRDPKRLKNDTSNGYVPVTAAQLEEKLEILINTLIPKKSPFVGTPPAGSSELETFYENLEDQYKEILYHIDELKHPKEELTNQEKRDNEDAISRAFITLAISSLHCGSRWQGEADDINKELQGIPDTLEGMLQRVMGKLRSNIANEIVDNKGADSHTKNTVLKQIGLRMAIPGSNKIVEHLIDPNLNEEDTLIYFIKTYTPRAMRDHLLVAIELNPKIRDGILAWFKDNPGEWEKERFEALKKQIASDPKWQSLIHRIQKGETEDTLLIKALRKDVRGIIPAGQLAEALTEIDEVKTKKPGEYPLELQVLAKKVYPELSLQDRQKFTALLAIDQDLQLAFHEMLLASLPDYETHLVAATENFISQLHKIENASKIMTYLKGKDVPINRDMAKRLATQPNYEEILENIFERQRGEEFTHVVYRSVGADFLEKMVDKLVDDPMSMESVNNTEQLGSWLRNMWKEVFADDNLEERELLIKSLDSDELAASLLATLKNPTNENMQHCKELLLQLPGFDYQFKKSEIMRLLNTQGFIKSRF